MVQRVTQGTRRVDCAWLALGLTEITELWFCCLATLFSAFPSIPAPPSQGSYSGTLRLVVTQREFAFEKEARFNDRSVLMGSGQPAPELTPLPEHRQSSPACAACQVLPAGTVSQPGAPRCREREAWPHLHRHQGLVWAPPRASHMGSFERGPSCGAQAPKNSCRRKAETSSERKTLLIAGLDR